MLTETTITKLREMRLSVMANALKDQLEDSQYNSMAFETDWGLLLTQNGMHERATICST